MLTPAQLQQARASYTRHKNEARKRFDKHGKPIQFLLTFEEWLAIWLASGQFNNRGVKAGQYVMARKHDIGPYSKDNVVIQLSSVNVSEAKKGRPFGFKSLKQIASPASSVNTASLIRRSAMQLTDDELRIARRKYGGKKKDCANRKDKLGNPIEMRLTFEDWLKVWLESGHYHNMGRGHGKYVMSRRNDIGHYEIGNVFIQLNSQNAREGKLGTKHSAATKTAMSKNRQGKPNGKKGAKHSTPAWNKGKQHSQEVKDAISAALTGYEYEKVTCPHCSKQTGRNNAKRYHFDNCKKKPLV